MKKIKLDIVNEYLYYEKLDNGLDVYLIKKDNFHTSFGCFLTNFGGIDTEFIPIGEKEMITVPSGIAHFLEHKLFEQETGESVHEFYNKSGTYVNAMTGYKTTKYIFRGNKNFKNNLLFLLDFVQKPYFTDENVLKEKGIILEEARMDLDNPNRKFNETILKNLYTSKIYDKTIIGSMDDIKSITKEDLYECYNSFYHPSNMALLIVTNEDVSETLDLIKNNQNKKKFKKDFVIKKKEYIEKEEVQIEKEVIKENVNETRVCYSIKQKLSSFNASKLEVYDYFEILFGITLGELSNFNIELKKKNIINNDIYYSISSDDFKDDCYITFKIIALTNKEDKFISLLEKELKKKDYSINDFNLYKKTLIADLNYDFNNINDIMSFMIGEYEFSKNISNDNIKVEKNLNFDRFIEVTNKLNVKNKSIVIMSNK